MAEQETVGAKVAIDYSNATIYQCVILSLLQTVSKNILGKQSRRDWDMPNNIQLVFDLLLYVCTFVFGRWNPWK